MTITDIIFDSNFTDLDEIYRFNGFPTHRKETVSQHSFWVALFTRMISESMFTENVEDNMHLEMLKLLYKNEISGMALFHDFDESLTGDILYNFKYNELNGDKVRALIDEYSEAAIIKEYKDRHVVGEEIYRSTAVQFRGALHKAHIKIADWLSCIKYERQEYIKGNRDIFSIMDVSINELLKHIATFQFYAIQNFGIVNINTTFLEDIKLQINKIKLH